MASEGRAGGAGASGDGNIFLFLAFLHFFLSEADSAGAAAAGHLASFGGSIWGLAAHKSFIMKLKWSFGGGRCCEDADSHRKKH